MANDMCFHILTTRAIFGILAVLFLAIPVDADYKDIAIIEALDKITGRVFTLEVPTGSETQFGQLKIKQRKCFKAPPEQPPESIAFLEISEFRDGKDDRDWFTGWMFASSPGLSTLEHPVYDLIVLDCYSPDSSEPTPSVTIKPLPPTDSKE